MKITPKILSIPPYISTSWSQIRTLYVREKNLVIYLADGVTVAIPNLSSEEIEAIFAAHAAFSEKTSSSSRPQQEQSPMQFLHNLPNSQFASSHPGQNEGMAAMHFNLDSLESFSSALHHNLEQAHMPNLPIEILNKIAAIAKIVAPGEIQNMPKPEPHCNCPHCQIARAIHGPTDNEKVKDNFSIEQKEEVVCEKDLSFQQWDISQSGDKLYVVTNRLDAQEKYNVYLGQPVGCTCGVIGCEHILAVLKS